MSHDQQRGRRDGAGAVALDQGVTTVFTWQVEPGREEDFQRWAQSGVDLAADFPGHQGVTWLRPQGRGGVYHGVLRFESPERMQEWLEHPERIEWIERADGIATEITEHRQQTTGMETWFQLPGTQVKAPPRWKMTLVTALGAYPVALLINVLLVPYAQPLPVWLRAALFPLLVAPVLTYAIMPWLSRLFRRWLYSDVPGRSPRSGTPGGRRAGGTVRAGRGS
ncbi:antibiotic biosynthesis monooxygenase [Streptomyces cavernae]|uniref:antibiotic biosynthesis monooxygenase n=1 Tax=Streptomyces cavernae TaxID=2259034 RepID=UPI000FEB947C|nr:antibiotic biosynthesis monooxygenase [Streptomyces cavernae]